MSDRMRRRAGRTQRRSTAEKKAQWRTPAERAAIDSDRPHPLRRLHFLDRMPARAQRRQLPTTLACYETYRRGAIADQRKGRAGERIEMSSSAEAATYDSQQRANARRASSTASWF